MWNVMTSNQICGTWHRLWIWTDQLLVHASSADYQMQRIIRWSEGIKKSLDKELACTSYIQDETRNMKMFSFHLFQMRLPITWNEFYESQFYHEFCGARLFIYTYFVFTVEIKLVIFDSSWFLWHLKFTSVCVMHPNRFYKDEQSSKIIHQQREETKHSIPTHVLTSQNIAVW